MKWTVAVLWQTSEELQYVGRLLIQRSMCDHASNCISFIQFMCWKLRMYLEQC